MRVEFPREAVTLHHAETPSTMIFEQLPIGGRKNFAYLVGDERTSDYAAIDVGFKPDLITDSLNYHDANLKYILATHSHRDHMGAMARLRNSTGATFAAFESITGVDMPLADGDQLRVGGVRIDVIHTPGHSPDSICLLINEQMLVTGDTLFVGKVPLRSLTKTAARQLFNSLQRLLTLDDRIEVWPGHDVGAKPSSTIGEERRTNPFLQPSNFEDFYRLKGKVS